MQLKKYRVNDSALFRHKLLHWLTQYPYSIYLDSCEHQNDPYGKFQWLAAINASDDAVIQDESVLVARQKLGKWLLGAFGYDYRLQTNPILQRGKPQKAATPPLTFFEPQILCYQLKGENIIHLMAAKPTEILEEIIGLQTSPVSISNFTEFSSNFSKQAYLSTVEKLRKHIYEGDFYEINFSQEFRGEAKITAPAGLFERLTAISPTPFAAYLKIKNTHIYSASPERFLQLSGERIITQPIKGTRPRGEDKTSDAALAQALITSEKERAENIMIVDLSRNDLNRSSIPGTVQVPELFGIHSFAKVHQMISTVSGIKSPKVMPQEVIQKAFPPGSMTGAPKVRSCERISQYERSPRGIYAGSIGYFDPLGDFDFNVVIRTLCYNETTKSLSYHVGGAITWDSDPAAEYAEAMAKGAAIREVFDKIKNA